MARKEDTRSEHSDAETEEYRAAMQAFIRERPSRVLRALGLMGQ